MQQCTETVTVYNHKYDRITGRDIWSATVIKGVSWHNEIKAVVTQNGLKDAKTATVRIPVDADTDDKTYMAPAAYKAAESVLGAYTLARGDILTHGEAPSGLTPAEAQERFECVTILGVTDNTTRPHGAHRKVVGA